MNDTVTENRKKIHKNSTLGEGSGKPPSGPPPAVEKQPEPDQASAAPDGCSGDTDQDEDDGPAAWCVMQSDVLNGDRFLLVRDDLFSDDKLENRITDEARQQADAVYRMTEMNHITAAELTDEDKRDLHELKKQFGGDVLGEDPAGEAVPMTEFGDWLDSKT